MDKLGKILKELEMMRIQLQNLIDFKVKANNVVAVAMISRFYKPKVITNTTIENIIIANAKIEEAINIINAYVDGIKQHAQIKTN